MTVYTPQEIDRILILSTRRRATPEDTAFISEMGSKIGNHTCVTCPSSVRQAFGRVVAQAHKDKAELDSLIQKQTDEMEVRLTAEADQTAASDKTTLDFTIEADCIHCLYKQPVSDLSNEQKIRLINEVAIRCGVTIKNCISCDSDLIEAQKILQEHMLNSGT